MQTNEAKTVDELIAELIAELDRKYSPNKWDFYQAALGHWCVRLPGEQPISADSLSNALAEAVAFVPLPKIPRRPEPLPSAEYWAIERAVNMREWQIKLEGHYVTRTKTRKEASELIDRMIEARKKLITWWEDNHGATFAAGTEGIDFRYEG